MVVRKAISILLILIAILLGTMYGHYTFLRQKGIVKSVNEYIAYLTKATEKVPGPQPVDAEGKPITGAEKKPVTPVPGTAKPEAQPTEAVTAAKIEKPKPALDTNLATALLRESEQLYKKMNYKEAIEKSRQVSSMLEKAQLEGSDLHTDALRIEMRSRAFNALVSRIPPNALSDGKGLESIELDSGNTVIVRVLKEDQKTGAVTIQKNDGIQATFTEDQIRKRTPVTRQDHVKKLTEELNKRIAKAKKDLYFDMFSLAIYAIQNRLTDRVTELLEKTFAIDGSELAYETFYTDKDQTEMVAMLLESFGRGEKAQSVRSRKVEPSGRIAQGPKESSSDSGASSEASGPPSETDEASALPDPLLEQIPESTEPSRTLALRYFAAGQDYVQKATLNPAKRFQFGQRAQKYLEKSADVLNKLLEQKPRDAELEQILNQVYDLLDYVVHNLVGVNK
jgi:hypothetical protein